MSGFAPVTYIAGPAIVTQGGQSWYSEGDIAVKDLMETWAVKTSAHGTIDERLKSQA